MARLINDSGVLGDAIEVTNKTVADVPFDKVIEAINVIQTRMGITGTTALEAGRTISGSVGAMKAAWTNLVTGFADGSADIGGLIDNLVTTIVGDGTENNLGVIGNVLPAIERALGGVVQLIAGAAPKIIEILPGLVDRIVPSLITAATDMVNAVIKVLPSLLQTIVNSLVKEAPALIRAAVSIVKSLVKGIKDNYKILVDGAISIVEELVNGIVDLLPEIIQLGLDLIVALANGIAESLPELIPTIVNVILQIVQTLTNPQTLSSLLRAALAIVKELAWGLVNNIDKIIEAVFTLLDGIIDFLVKPENLAMLVETAIELVLAIGTGIVKAIPQLLVSVLSLIGSIFTEFVTADWASIGKDLVDGLLGGLKNAWKNLTSWFDNAWDKLVGGAKKILGIHSPSRVFADIGKNMALGVGDGWKDEFGDIQNDINDSLSFDDPYMGITASVHKSGTGTAGMVYGGISFGDIIINVDGARYSDEQSLASAIAQEIQNMTDRRSAVYA